MGRTSIFEGRRDVVEIWIWIIAGSVCFLTTIFGVITSIVFWKKRQEEKQRTGVTLIIIVTLVCFVGTLNSLLRLLQLLRHS